MGGVSTNSDTLSLERLKLTGLTGLQRWVCFRLSVLTLWLCDRILLQGLLLSLHRLAVLLHVLLLPIKLHRLLLSLNLTELLWLLRLKPITLRLLLWHVWLTITLHWLLRLTKLLWLLAIALIRLRLSVLLGLLAVLLHTWLARLLNWLAVLLHTWLAGLLNGLAELLHWLLLVGLHRRLILVWLLHGRLAGLYILGLYRLLGLSELLLLHRLWWTLHGWLLDINCGWITWINQSELLLPLLRVELDLSTGSLLGSNLLEVVSDHLKVLLAPSLREPNLEFDFTWQGIV